jgi:solute carrier family 27 fatty acid transporter 1/4
LKVEEASNRIGNYFSQHGLKKGNVVPLFMENRIEVIITWLGLSKVNK